MEILKVLRSVQRALLGRVTPNLRAVYVVFAESTLLLFFYDQPPSEDEQELASLADTDFIADYPDEKTDCKVTPIPYPGMIPKEGYCVYHRFEGDILA